jgi:hypothetical protein
MRQQLANPRKRNFGTPDILPKGFVDACVGVCRHVFTFLRMHVWVYVGMSCGAASSLAEALTNKRPARVPATTSTVLPVRPLLVLPLGEPAISKLQKKKSSPGLVISRSVPVTLALLL